MSTPTPYSDQTVYDGVPASVRYHPGGLIENPNRDRDASPIGDRVDQMSAQIGALDEMVGNLRDRLGPILKPLPGQHGLVVEKDAEPARLLFRDHSPLHGRIEDLSRQLEEAILQIRSLHERLEV